MHYLKKVGLLAVWLVLSFELLLLLERVAQMHSPGSLLAERLAPSGPDRSIALWGWLGAGIDFALCFVAVYGLYVIFVRFLRHVEK
jgi:hypothetical protein